MRTHIGPHRVQVFLGSGGDGEVWAATEALTGARIAIKLALGEPSRGRLGRVVREYQILRELDLEGVPRARGLGVDEAGQLFMVMDLVDGISSSTWAERVMTRGRDVARVLRVLGAAGDMLGKVHAQGVLHGDVKPSCFLVGEGDRVSVVDFGGARPMDPGGLTAKIEENFGTPVYTAPEALEGAPPSVPTEVFGLAAASFRLLTSGLPVGRGGRAELRARWKNTTPAELEARLRGDCPELPEPALGVLVAALSTAPEARPTLAEWCAAMALAAPAQEASAAAEEARKGPTSGGLGGSTEYTEGDAGRVTLELLTIAGGALSPRVLGRALGVSPRRALAELAGLRPAVTRAEAGGWRLAGEGLPASSPDVARRLAWALADEPVGPERIRALAAAGEQEPLVEALERWTTTLAGAGRLEEAVPLVAGLPRVAPGGPRGASLEGRLLLVRAKVALAAPTYDLVLDRQLERVGARDAVLAPALAKARWALARHFGTLHAASTPSSLAVGWRALVMGHMDAARTAADTALDEARWLRLGEAEADALLLSSHVRAAAGELGAAARLAAEALDRWPARAPGLGEAVATLARWRHRQGALSEARFVLGARADEAPTAIDRLHLLLGLAELELDLEHQAVAEDALRQVEAMFGSSRPPFGLEARLMALRLTLPGKTAPSLTWARERLVGLAQDGLALFAGGLAPTVAHAALAVGELAVGREAASIAAQAAAVVGDPELVLASEGARVALARALGGASEVDPAVARRGEEARLWPGLMRLGLKVGERGLVARGLNKIVPMLDQADANALTLTPWAVALEEGAARRV